MKLTAYVVMRSDDDHGNDSWPVAVWLDETTAEAHAAGLGPGHYVSCPMPLFVTIAEAERERDEAQAESLKAMVVHEMCGRVWLSREEADAIEAALSRGEERTRSHQAITSEILADALARLRVARGLGSGGFGYNAECVS